MRVLLLINFLFLVNIVYSQKLSEADSMLRKKYYHRIVPKAVNSKSDILYDGIDNAIELQYPDEASKYFNYVLKTHNGIIFESDNGYATIPRNSGRAFISVYIVAEDKDTFLVGKKEFQVENVPIPTVKIGNKIIKDESVIDKAIFLKNDSLKVFFTDDIVNSENWCSVQYFNLGYSYGGRYISVDNKGAVLSKKTLDFIKQLKLNQNMVIKVSEINCSKIIKHLPLVRFKVN